MFNFIYAFLTSKEAKQCLLNLLKSFAKSAKKTLKLKRQQPLATTAKSAYGRDFQTKSVLSTMLLALMVISSLTACGTEEKEKQASEQKEESSMQSMALDTKADMPDCTAKVKNQLIYIRDEAQFYVCDKDWEEIEIGSGVSKAKADDTDPETMAVNSWVDPVNNRVWLLGNKGDFPTAQTSCDGKYRLPTESEASVAMAHGIRPVAQKISTDLKDFWMDSGKVMSTYSNGSAYIMTSAPTNVVAIFCIKS